MLGPDVLNVPAWLERLPEEQATRFSDALRKLASFRVRVTLLDGRHFDVDVERSGEAVRGSLEEIGDPNDVLETITRAEEFCRAIADNSPAMLWMGDQNGKCVFLNKAQREFWGVDPDDLSMFDWSSTVHPDDVEILAKPFGQAMAGQTAFSVEARYRRADGQFRILRTQARPRFDDDGVFLGMTGLNSDVSDRRHAEERTRMLMGELNHRTKNSLSVVQAVARQTLKSTSADEFQTVFSDRLMSLAASNDLLLANDWSGVDVLDLVNAQLAHLSDVIGKRLIVSGPKLRINANAAQTLGMALHELSTNSLKHGALFTANGRVDLTWKTGGEGDATRFEITWIESGLSDVKAPTRKGFGHAVIVDMIAQTFDADVDVRFDPDGFKWIVRSRRASLEQA